MKRPCHKRRRQSPGRVTRRVRYHPRVEGLEERRLLDAALVDGIWTIHGTNITVTRDPANPDLLRATESWSLPDLPHEVPQPQPPVPLVYTQPASAVRGIRLEGGAGNDHLSLDSALAIPATIIGG